MELVNSIYRLNYFISVSYVMFAHILVFNSDCQDWRKSVRNEFFKVWLVCIPFQLSIKDRKLCQAVSTNSYRQSILVCHAKQGGHKNSFPSLYSFCSILAESLS